MIISLSSIYSKIMKYPIPDFRKSDQKNSDQRSAEILRKVTYNNVYDSFFTDHQSPSVLVKETVSRWSRVGSFTVSDSVALEGHDASSEPWRPLPLWLHEMTIFLSLSDYVRKSLVDHSGLLHLLTVCSPVRCLVKLSHMAKNTDISLVKSFRVHLAFVLRKKLLSN